MKKNVLKKSRKQGTKTAKDSCLDASSKDKDVLKNICILDRKGKLHQRREHVAHAKALRESEEQWHKTILRMAMDGFLRADSQGRLLEVNTAYCQMSGYSEEELLAMSISDLESDKMPANTASHMQAMITQGGHRFESLHRRKDGSFFAVEVSMQYKPTEGGEVVAFLRNITERKEAEAALRRSSEELRALAVHLQNVREEERAALARELHDTLGQNLTGLHIDLLWLDQRMQSDMPRDVEAWRDKVAAMEPLVDRLIEAAQSISSSLRLGMLDDLGLVAAIEWQAREFETRTGLPCSVSLPKNDIELDPKIALAFFRILQEALTNVVRHAQATRVEVRLHTFGNGWELVIQDNGRGFEPESISGPKALGVLGMRERVAAFGGTLDLLSKPRKGSTVRIRMPVA